jgi:tetratricopeptide (TPR) repeat protein
VVSIEDEEWKDQPRIAGALRIEKRALEMESSGLALMGFKMAATLFGLAASEVSFDRYPEQHKQLLQRVMINVERLETTQDTTFREVTAYHTAFFVQLCLDDGHAEGLTLHGEPISYSMALGWYQESKKLFQSRKRIPKGLRWLEPALLGGQVQVLTALGKLEEATSLRQELADKYPNSKEYREILMAPAEKLYETGKYPEAIKAYQAVYNQYPALNAAEDALHSIGYCYERMGDIHRAIIAYEKAVEVFPNLKGWSELTYYNLGCVYEKVGEIGKALNAFKQSVVLCKGKRKPDEFPYKESKEWIAQLKSRPGVNKPE